MLVGTTHFGRKSPLFAFIRLNCHSGTWRHAGLSVHTHLALIMDAVGVALSVDQARRQLEEGLSADFRVRCGVHPRGFILQAGR
jgi:hypothetical protein